jgi:hypothetical protein
MNIVSLLPVICLLLIQKYKDALKIVKDLMLPYLAGMMVFLNHCMLFTDVDQC